MPRKPNPNAIGSDFEDFLASEGMLEDADAYAIKRVLAWQLAEAMREQNVSKSDLALRMKTSRPVIDRLLTASQGVTLDTVSRAAIALGMRAVVTLHAAKRPPTPVASSRSEAGKSGRRPSAARSR